MKREKLLAAFREAAVDVLSVAEDKVTEAASRSDDLGAGSVELVEILLILAAPRR